MTPGRCIALVAAFVALEAHADQAQRGVASTTLPCFSNHFILDEPCAQWQWQWQWHAASRGLTNPDVHVLQADPSNGMILYAGGASGLFTSADGGASWAPGGLDLTGLGAQDSAAARSAFGLPPTFGATSIVTQIAVDPANPRTLYAGTHSNGSAWFGQRRLFKSTDAGETWTDRVSPAINGVDNIHSLVIAPSRPSTIYLSVFDDSTGDTWSPMVRSADGGASWDYVPLLAYVLINVLAVDPEDARTLYAGTFAYPPQYTPLPDGVLRSVDGGETWQPSGLTGPGISAIAIARTTPRTIYAATSSDSSAQARNGLFRSTDGGLTWARSESGLGDFPLTAVVVDPADPRTVYAAAFGAGVARSVDGGVTWDLVNEGLADLFVRTLLLVPGDAGAVYAGTRSGVFKLGE